MNTLLQSSTKQTPPVSARLCLRAIMGLAVLFSLSGNALASWYPPDYILNRTCQSQGAVEVCAINQRYGNYPRLEVTYRGPLQDRSWGRLSAFIKLNGHHGMFKLENMNFADSVTLGRRDFRLCIQPDPLVPDAPPPTGGISWCEYEGQPAGGYGWQADRASSPEEQHVLFYARNSNGLGNAWDIEIAVVDESGNWDSNLGNNYQFRFEP